MSWLAWSGAVLGLAAVVGGGGLLYLAIVLAWEDQRTRGIGYYGLPAAERERFRSRLKVHARLLFPVLRLVGRFSTVTLERASFRFRGISGPKGTCTPDSFRLGHEYTPRPQDVFVVTQMKCGTTWMQHLVYQVSNRGRGDLAETGRALYAVAPWLEAVRSVSVADGPLVGEERPTRIIKTHFPADLCPFAPEARYVYVARHPVSCFASCAHFIAENLGVFAPDLDDIRSWFCSEDGMWWGTWPRHVEGWRKLAQAHDNVFFVTFEEMKRELSGVARELTAFLAMDPLGDDELASVVEKCGFAYMKRHSTSFEMHPPHLLAVDAELFARGTADRYRDVPEDVRGDILAWCREELSGGDLPLELLYPELGVPPAGAA